MTENEKIDLLLAEMQGMKSDMQGMKTEMQGMKTDMQDMKTRLDSLESKVKDIGHDVTNINLVLENEIRVNIKRVAEGHLDLSRSLHEAMRPSNEQEMLALRVGILESDVGVLKEKIS